MLGTLLPYQLVDLMIRHHCPVNLRHSQKKSDVKSQLNPMVVLGLEVDLDWTFAKLQVLELP